MQNILIKNGMASKYDRWLKLEEKRAGEPIELTGEQVAFIEKQNPSFKECHIESSRPGELLCQDTFYVGRLKGVGRVYLHAVVDTFSSYAFGFLHPTKRPEAAASVLHNDVLPFYGKKEITIASVLTDNGREFCGTDTHPYEMYLQLNDIEHRRTKVRSPRTNGVDTPNLILMAALISTPSLSKWETSTHHTKNIIRRSFLNSWSIVTSQHFTGQGCISWNSSAPST